MIEAMPEKRNLNYGDRQLNQKRQVRLKTCADVYEHWRSYKRLYKKAPKDGVEFQIDYIDTGLAMSEEERAKAPIALALHGAPGSYHDFNLLINHLASQRVRVIAPNFPEYIATVKTKVLFRHSADEKAAYLRDFLKAIDVKSIDLLVSHSSAIFPTLLILLNANNLAIERQKQQHRRLETAEVGNLARTRGGQQQRPVAALDSLSREAKVCTLGGQSDTRSGSERSDDELENGETFVDANDGNNDHARQDDLVLSLTQVKLAGATGDQSNEQVEAATRRLAPAKGESDTVGQAGHQRRHRRNSRDVIVRFDEPIEIKSVAFFNPAGHRLPKSMKPTWFKCGSVPIYQHKLGRSLFRKFGPAFLTVVGVPVRVDNMDNVMLSATVMRNSKCQRVIKQLQQLSQMKIPTLLVFSENDKLIEKEIFYEMTQFMRLDSTKFDVFNNDGDIELSQSMLDDWIRVMVFKAGGHYAYSNYAKTVNKAVSELLSRVTGI